MDSFGGIRGEISDVLFCLLTSESSRKKSYIFIIFQFTNCWVFVGIASGGHASTCLIFESIAPNRV
jgi:hypothetical protein